MFPEIDTIWIQPGYSGREAVKSIQAAKALGYQVGWGVNPDKSRCAPIGDVPYCESWLARRPVPDFYPEFLRSFFHRRIEFIHAGEIQNQGIDLFAKSAEGYKDFPARVFSRHEGLPRGDLWISSPVKFVQEWRYYVADGCVLTTGWYDGRDENEPAPDLDIKWPRGWHGAADFGRLDTGEMALVECHHPFACGHYSDDHAAYVMWVVEGWNFMRSRHN